MSNPEYLTDRSHILIAGVTGARTDYGGKTALANWWASEWGATYFDLVLFLNSKADDAPAEAAEIEVESVGELAEAMAGGHRHICLTPASADWETVHARLGAFIRELPNDMSKLVAHDEAPELDPEKLQWFVRVAGNGSNCKSLVIAQAPGDLPTAVRRQCILCWVGPVTENNRHVFRANSRENHFEAMRVEHDPYEWSVLLGPDDGDRDHHPPVPEEYA